MPLYARQSACPGCCRLGLPRACAQDASRSPGPIPSADRHRGQRLGVEPDLPRGRVSLSGAADYEVFTLADPDRVVIDLSQVGLAGAGRQEAGPGPRPGRGPALWPVQGRDLARSCWISRRRVAVTDRPNPARPRRPSRPADHRSSSARIGAYRPRSRRGLCLGVDAGAGCGGRDGPGLVHHRPRRRPSMPTSRSGRSRGGRCRRRAAARQNGQPAPPPAPKPSARSRGRSSSSIPAMAASIRGPSAANGTMEKNVTLAMAKQLQRQLAGDRPYRVVMTRDSDVFMPLRDRFEIARRQACRHVHLAACRCHPRDPARGASVYTLSEKASDAEAEALAAKENKADVIAGVDLSQQSNTVIAAFSSISPSARPRTVPSQFAALLVGASARTTQMVQQRPSLRRLRGAQGARHSLGADRARLHLQPSDERC